MITFLLAIVGAAMMLAGGAGVLYSLWFMLVEYPIWKGGADAGWMLIIGPGYVISFAGIFMIGRTFWLRWWRASDLVQKADDPEADNGTAE